LHCTRVGRMDCTSLYFPSSHLQSTPGGRGDCDWPARSPSGPLKGAWHDPGAVPLAELAHCVLLCRAALRAGPDRLADCPAEGRDLPGWLPAAPIMPSTAGEAARLLNRDQSPTIKGQQRPGLSAISRLKDPPITRQICYAKFRLAPCCSCITLLEHSGTCLHNASLGQLQRQSPKPQARIPAGPAALLHPAGLATPIVPCDGRGGGQLLS